MIFNAEKWKSMETVHMGLGTKEIQDQCHPGSLICLRVFGLQVQLLTY